MPVATLGEDEFVQAFADHGRTLWLLAAAWVGRGEAQDLVQEAARVAWQRRLQFTDGTDLRPWLSQIVRHVGANWRRRKRPEPRAPADLPNTAASPVLGALWPFRADAHLSDELAQALDALPEVARACLLLHVIAEHTFAEIAAMLDVPPNTVGSHVRRAREALRTALAPTTGAREPLPESS